MSPSDIFQMSSLNFNWLKQRKVTEIRDEIQILNSGIIADPQMGNLDQFWFNIRRKVGDQIITGYQVIRLLELCAIPLNARSDAGLLQKMRTVLRSLYSAEVNFFYLAAGIFNPLLGISQCYGVTGFSHNLDDAQIKTSSSMSVLNSCLSAIFPQIQLRPPNIKTGEWLYRSFDELTYAAIAVGQPDPRENSRGESLSLFANPITQENGAVASYSMQQNELLFRGMSQLQEDFLFLILTSPVSLFDLSRMLTGLAEETSVWASRQQGVRGISFGISVPAMLSGAMVQNSNHGFTQGEGYSQTLGNSYTDGYSRTEGIAHTEGISSTQGVSHSTTEGITETSGQSVTIGRSVTEGESVAHGISHNVSDGSSYTETQSVNNSVNVGLNGGLKGGIVIADANVGGNVGYSHGVGQSNSVGATHSESNGESLVTTHSRSETLSESTTNQHSVSVSQQETNGTFASQTNSIANTTSESDTISQAETQSAAASATQNSGVNRGLGNGLTSGMSIGLASSISLSQSYQWQDDPIILLTQMLRTQQKLLSLASKEGAFFTDVYAFAKTDHGMKALLGLIPQSFHGTEDVVTGVQTRQLVAEERNNIRLHGMTFLPSLRRSSIADFLNGYVDSTLLTMLQVAAYTAPGMYEMGKAVTVQEATPSFAFYPQLDGNVELGTQYSTEIGMLTHVPIKLSASRHFHTAFCGDTGFGKSVAAERMAFETTSKWHYRTIVLDFGQGWRKALLWPSISNELVGRVDIHQLYPGAKKPLKWNILQVPKRMLPGRYRTMVAELFANAGNMGPRQQGFIRRALTEMYQQYGVFTFDRDTWEDPVQGTLTWEEYIFLHQIDENVTPETPLSEMEENMLQTLACFRSKQADISELVGLLKKIQEKLPRNDVTSRTSLEGVLLRLEPFAEGHMAMQYGKGDSSAIEDLGLLGTSESPWGISIIEGGAEMDEYPKIALLSLLASILYFDAVVRRRESLNHNLQFPPMQIFFEEANKVLSGVSGGASSDTASASSHGTVSEIFQTFWRDGRKYKIFLHPIVQTVSTLPEGIFSSCNNMVVVQTKNPKDRDLVLAQLGKSEKGFVNTEYKRYLARIPQQMAIIKLGYSTDVFQLEPVLFHPLMVPGVEPSDSYIN